MKLEQDEYHIAGTKKSARNKKDLQISVVDSSTVAVIHGIDELLKVSSSVILLKSPLLSLLYDSNPRMTLVKTEENREDLDNL